MSLLVITTSDVRVFIPYLIHVAHRDTNYTCSFLDAHVYRISTWFTLQIVQDYCGCFVRNLLNLFIIDDIFFHILKQKNDNCRQN